MPVLNKSGTPKRDANGKIVYQPASKWLDKNRPIEMVTWAPGLPLQIQDRLISMGGWIERKGVSCFNLYRPPRIKLGDASKAGPWLDHFHKIYPEDAASNGWRTARSAQARKSTMRSCLVVNKASARIRYWSR